MNPSSAMQQIGEMGGCPVYWAEPGRFETPGVYFWDGTENVSVPLQLSLSHNERPWTVIFQHGAWFARDDSGNDTGPYSTPAEAVEWIKAIRP